MKAPPIQVFIGIAFALLFLAIMTTAFDWRAPAVSRISTEATTTTIAISGKKLTLTTTNGIERWYTNEKFRFSFRLADGFLAAEGDPGVPGGRAVLVRDRDEKNRLTLYVLPAEGLTALIPADLEANLSAAGVRNIREGFAGTLVRGLFFTYDASGEERTAFWFSYNGHAYELSTSAEDAVLLDYVVSTWRFAPPTPPTPPKPR